MLVLASDHFGFPLKKVIADYLREEGFAFEDLGVFSEDEVVDYPDIALRACLGIREVHLWDSGVRHRDWYGDGSQQDSWNLRGLRSRHLFGRAGKKEQQRQCAHPGEAHRGAGACQNACSGLSRKRVPGRAFSPKS